MFRRSAPKKLIGLSQTRVCKVSKLLESDSTTEKGKVTGKNFFQQRSVDGIDLWRFVSEQRQSGCDFIAIKLDVEGTEYRLIDSLYARWKRSGDRLVDYLLVEFHEDLLPEGRNAQYYAGVLEEMKIYVSRWL